VQTGQQGTYLFVVDAEQKVAIRPVTAGISWQELTVIEAGLEAGETVVTAGQLRLAPGARVTAKAAEPPATADSRP
jgi:multidrug efflux system membrane fusion protein